ncbi:hypothetical protein ACH4MA_21870 [Streptomyces roseolus]|uniref:hypothetical protein n=1 Tax=Streptomyces roseolus TaxID=67358 RepID=UPI00378F40AB
MISLGGADLPAGPEAGTGVRLPEPELRPLAAGLAEALEAVHRASPAHRDLKPSNIVVAEDRPGPFGEGPVPALLHGVVHDEPIPDDMPPGPYPPVAECLEEPWGAAGLTAHLDPPPGPHFSGRASPRLMTSRWIWFVPSKICMILASRM